MPSSIKSILTDVLNLVPAKVPSQFVGNLSDEGATLALASAKYIGEEILNRHHWSILTKEHSIATIKDQAEYDLPSDYLRMIDKTVWDRTNFHRMRGDLSPAQWQALKSSIVSTSSITKRYRLKASGNQQKFVLDPTPSVDGEDLIFEYLSSQWVVSASGTRQTSILADTDQSMFSDTIMRAGILAFILNRQGLSYIEEQTRYDDMLEAAKMNDSPANSIDIIPGHDDTVLIDPLNVPEAGFGQ